MNEWMNVMTSMGRFVVDDDGTLIMAVVRCWLICHAQHQYTALYLSCFYMFTSINRLLSGWSSPAHAQLCSPVAEIGGEANTYKMNWLRFCLTEVCSASQFGRDIFCCEAIHINSLTKVSMYRSLISLSWQFIIVLRWYNTVSVLVDVSGKRSINKHAHRCKHIKWMIISTNFSSRSCFFLISYNTLSHVFYVYNLLKLNDQTHFIEVQM